MSRVRYALGVTLALALLVFATGCGLPSGGAGTGPRDNRPPAGPPQPPPGGAEASPAGYLVYFEVEVLAPPGDFGRRPKTGAPVIITVEVLQTDGYYATYYNPRTGERAQKPFVDTVATPYAHGVSFGPGIASATFTVVYAGFTDEQLSCWVDRNGRELPGSRDTDTIGPTATGRGGGKVTCHYVPA